MASGIKNLEQAFNDVINNAVDIANDVVRSVGQKVQTDMYDKANKTLEAYYADYTPKVYRRTYSLKRAIKPYTQAMSRGGLLTLEVGIEYDHSRLDGMYESNSYYHQQGLVWRTRNDSMFYNRDTANGTPRPYWILNNFLKGLHPITVVNEGLEEDGTIKREYTYSPYQGSTKPLKLMEDFVNKELESKIPTYVQEELWNTIAGYF